MIKKVSFCLLFILFIITFISSCRSGPGTDMQDGEKNNTRHPADKMAWLYISEISMFNNISSWQYTYENTDVAVINIAVIKKLKSDEIKLLTDAVNSSHMKLAIECSGLVNVFGTDTFHNISKSMAYNSVNHTQKGEYTYLSALIGNGCKIDYLVFKNPVINAVYPNADYKTQDKRYMSIAEAVSQTIDAMKYWREHLPDIQFMIYTDFFSYGWKDKPAYNYVYGSDFGAGDYFYELSLMAEAAKKNGIPLLGIVVNNPYDYAMGRRISKNNTTVKNGDIDWMKRICDLENECNALGLDFILTLNGGMSSENGTDEKFYRDIVHYINKYSEAGGTPEGYMIQGGKFPSGSIPENKNFTLTYDASKLIAQFKYGEKVVLSASKQNNIKAPENLSLICEWDFNTDPGGWNKSNNISDFYTENGYLVAISDGSDPFFISDDSLDIDTADCDYLYIKYLNISSYSDRMEFFFSTYESPGMDEIKTIKFPVDSINDDDIWSEIYIPLRQCSSWKGALKQMRIDPGMTEGEFRFDRIALYNQR